MIAPKGYQLIEPPPLASLLAATRSACITVAVLTWVIELVRAELKERLGPASVEIVRAEYLGAYPAIGLKYASEDAEDLGSLVEETIGKLLDERGMSAFIDYVASTNSDWAGIAAKVLEPAAS